MLCQALQRAGLLAGRHDCHAARVYSLPVLAAPDEDGSAAKTAACRQLRSRDGHSALGGAAAGGPPDVPGLHTPVLAGAKETPGFLGIEDRGDGCAVPSERGDLPPRTLANRRGHEGGQPPEADGAVLGAGRGDGDSCARRLSMRLSSKRRTLVGRPTVQRAPELLVMVAMQVTPSVCPRSVRAGVSRATGGCPSSSSSSGRRVTHRRTV